MLEATAHCHPATTVVAGHASGLIVALGAPLSFWGGFDATSGVIVETKHPQAGLSLTGKVVLLPATKGSSSSSSVLAEAIRNGTAPAGIVMLSPDLIVALGAIVASELYGTVCPLVTVSPPVFDALAGATGRISICARSNGVATLESAPGEAGDPGGAT